MSDLTQEAGIVEFPDDATGISPHPGAETAAVPNAFATELAELAWSHEDARAEISTSKDASPDEKRGPAWWIAAIAAVLVTAAAAVWLGTVLYREVRPTPVRAPTPTDSPPVALPTEMPHPAPKYPWMAIAVGNDVRPGGKRAFGYGFGLTEDTATQAALTNCRTVDQNECTRTNAAANACMAIAVNPSGAYTTSSGPSRSMAAAAAKSNLGQANRVQAFCSWDGNDS